MSQDGSKPLDGVNIDHALHVEQINCDLDSVPLAYLVDWLKVGAIYQSFDLRLINKFIVCKWIFKLF